ncbi:coproporphyrinogen-III oxidase [Marivirga tractuosa]|uniref:Coproporphyrinogen-III oxidase n=1 Tax=Marivirga tractuosa (strain ATCC 23168 / DSM 4126 / NBRC 15989 / NCIMB 1408 / VKM B-1430 / H-43) TaxID=643867 RepID=E4TQT8_MARTH|nr:oxygen-independent coproporphyrinogen III oxidase [Marivirga tractuosa]ADR21638.1 oxygen-independent coproporphyrinogen III oxidase [Marivirga tractuosa DSM 4126]BDD13905.1 coproporphyrinogen-III oxidase [Marivirga tractuosa]
MTDLSIKYNKAIPRYTSYPTVPHWKLQNPDQADWLNEVKSIYFSQVDKSISLYMHLPFCESLCTYCGCNKRITKNHGVEERYIDALLAEWDIYVKALEEKPVIRNIHLGGGTPTFFSSENLHKLLFTILETSEIHPQKAFSFEGHPNNTTYEQLKVLADLGFDRVSFGVQDFNLQVQKAIHRIQPIENVRKTTAWARELGYTSVNYDLIYGLPFQTLVNIEENIEKLREFKPERIALYSYAHVPWKSKAQRGYGDEDLPKPDEKLAMYLRAKQLLNEMGYENIGMDHYALPQDELTIAKEKGYLNRNFMGYTTDQNQMMIGLGCSAISATGTAFVQNEKVVEKYQTAVLDEKLPLTTGHFLTEEEETSAQLINQLICNGKADFSTNSLSMELWEGAKSELDEMQDDGLVEIDDYFAKVTEEGMLFVRNICSLFDPKLKQKSDKPQFSQSI